MGEAARTRITSGRRRRFGRRLLAVCASALALGATTGPALQSAAAVAVPASSGGGAAVALRGLSPAVPVKGDTLTLTGTVKNTGRSALHGASVDIRMNSGALSSRSDIDDVLSRKNRATAADGAPVPEVHAKLPPVRPGAAAPFTLKVPVSKLRLQGDGVYQLGVEAVGGGGTPLGITRSFLPWFPDPSNARATRTATLWPLVDRPRITARTGADQQMTPVFRDDGLATELKPDGRLGKLVSLGDSLPVTWVVDPDLANTADAMTKPYRVARGGGDDTVAGKGGAVARHWLTDLQWSMVRHKEAQKARKQIAANGGGSSGSPATPPSGGPTSSQGGAGGAEKNGKHDEHDGGGKGSAPSDSPPSTGNSGGATQPNPLNAPHDDIVALPDGDPDLASIAHRGGSTKQLPALLKNAHDLSASPSTTLVLGGKPRTDVAWPVGGALDPSIVRAGRQAGASAFIASSSSLQQHNLSYTPAAARPIGGGSSAVVADARISSILAGDLSSPAKRTQAVQQFLAQTLMITMEAPSKQRTLLVTPPRRMSAQTASTLATALKAADKGGWIDPATLKDVQHAKPDAAANSRVPSASAYPRSLAGDELPASALAQVGEVNDGLRQMVRILTKPQRVTGPMNQAMMRMVSASWREDADGRRDYEHATGSYLRRLVDAVTIAPKTSTVTLSGQSATIPITVFNNLEQTVKVRLQLISEQPTRVTVGKPHTLTIPARTNRQVEFPTTAKINGRAGVTAQLFDAAGHTYGPDHPFTINATSVGDNVLIVVAIGLAIVVVAIIRMYRRRAKRFGVDDNPDAPAAEPGDGAAGPSDGAEPGSDGPGPSGDAASPDPTETDRTAADGADRRAGPDGAEPEPRPDTAPDTAPDTEPDGADQSGPDEKVKK